MSIALASGMRITPPRINALIPLYAVKTADESISANTAAQDDDHLFVTVEAGARYRLMMTLLIGGTSNIPDLRAVFAMPAGSTLSAGGLGLTAGDVLNVGALSAQTASPVGPYIFGTPTSGVITALIPGDLAVGATGGTCRLQWSQQTSNAAATVLKAGSWLELRRYS
jgi:hypothetical protein